MDSFVQQGVTLRGNLRLKGVALIDGKIYGNVRATDHLIVGASGHIVGNIEAGHVTNRGWVDGNIRAGNKVSLMKDSHLKGDIVAFQLVIEEGSNFDGSCKMLDKPLYTREPAGQEVSAPPAVPADGVSPAELEETSQLGRFMKQIFGK